MPEHKQNTKKERKGSKKKRTLESAYEPCHNSILGARVPLLVVRGRGTRLIRGRGTRVVGWRRLHDKPIEKEEAKGVSLKTG